MPESTQGTLDPFEQRLRFGSFEILRDDQGKPCLLGKGAFGRTYKARHVFLERTVALKIINDKFVSDQTARDRFLTEARAAAKLTHPHIAQILDFGETDGVLFYAMEYCSGGDLAEYVKRNGPLSVVQTVQIGLQVGSALQCAHGEKFIHRDLKPSNVMLAAPDGPIVTKLIDFGLVIAKPDENDEPPDPDMIPTIEQRFIGTPLFASPEQLLVQPLDGRSDFFSLGMSLWFLLLGSAPDPGSSAAIVTSRLSAESYTSRLPKKLPRSFHALLARLLEKKPQDRFENAAALVAAAAACAAELGLPTAPLGAYGVSPTASTVGSPATEMATTSWQNDLEDIDAPLEQCYSIRSQEGANLTGDNYEASTGDGTAVILHVLKPTLLRTPKLFEQVRKHVATLQKGELPGVLRPIALRAHSDRTAVVLEKPVANDLLTELKSAGVMRLAEARVLLQSIANGCDTLAAAGLPAPEIEAHRILVQRPAGAANFADVRTFLFPRFLTHRDAASLAPEDPDNDATTTMTYDMLMDDRADVSGWQFATLIYRIISGRNCPQSATLSPQGYIAVPTLSEEGNRLLALAIARQLVHPTCGELLADLLIAEGLMGGMPTRTHLTTGGHPSHLTHGTHGSHGSQGTAGTSGLGTHLTHGTVGPQATHVTQGSSGGVLPPPLTTTTPPSQQSQVRESVISSSLPHPTTTGSGVLHPTQSGTKLVPRQLGTDLSREIAPPIEDDRRRRGPSMMPIIAMMAAGFLVIGGGAFYLVTHPELFNRGGKGQPPQSDTNTPTAQPIGSATVKIVGDLPPHSKARLNGTNLEIAQAGSSWSVALDAANASFPATLSIEAKGFTAHPIELREKADLAKEQEVRLVRHAGTVSFNHANGADYVRANFRMLSPLPDEEPEVEVERNSRAMPLGDGQMSLPTGIYQLTLHGNNDRIVNPRPIGKIEVRPGQSQAIDVPPTFAGTYRGTATVDEKMLGSGASWEVEINVQQGLNEGTFTETGQNGTRRILMRNGKLNAQGHYVANIIYSDATALEPRYDQMLTIKRQADGALQFETIETYDEQGEMVKKLHREPLPKESFAVTGTLRSGS